MNERSSQKPLRGRDRRCPGIGLATVEHLLERGYDVLGVDLDGAPATLGGGGAVSWVAGDVAKAAGTWEQVAASAAVAGRDAADAFAAYAGTLVSAPLLGPVEDWQRIFGVNLFGTLRGIHALVPAMRRQPGRGSRRLQRQLHRRRGHAEPLLRVEGGTAPAGPLGRPQYAADGLRINALLPGVVGAPLLRGFVDVLDDPLAALSLARAAHTRSRPDHVAGDRRAGVFPRRRRRNGDVRVGSPRRRRHHRRTTSTSRHGRELPRLRVTGHQIA